MSAIQRGLFDSFVTLGEKKRRKKSDDYYRASDIRSGELSGVGDRGRASHAIRYNE